MPDSLYLRFVGDEVEWLLGEGGRNVVERGRSGLAELEERLADRHWTGPVHLLAPGQDVFLTHTRVPSKQQRQILQALPYMVEEQVAQDVEDCHFAMGERSGDGDVSVAVVDKSRLERWLERLEDSGLSPTRVVPDVLCVPFDEGIHVLIDGTRALVRTGTSDGIVVEKDLLPATLSLMPEPQSITIHVHPSARQGVGMQLTQIEAETDARLSVEELAIEPFECLCRGSGDGINLLQGDYKVAEETSDHGTGWRMAAILAACAFGLHILLLIGQGIYMDVKASQYEREARALYADVFPSDTNVRDMRRRWQAHLGSASGGGGEFFRLFSETARHLPDSQLTLQNVNFNESRGDLILQLVAPESEQFVAYSQKLSESGLEAEVGTINQDDELARGSIKVKVSGG